MSITWGIDRGNMYNGKNKNGSFRKANGTVISGETQAYKYRQIMFSLICGS